MALQKTAPTLELLTSIELMQPVVKTPALHHFPPDLMAHCDQPGHLFVRLGGVAHGMDTLTALRLLRDLRLAVEASAGWPPQPGDSGRGDG